MSRLAQILWLAISIACGNVFAQGDIRWAPDLETARRAAAQFQVPLMVHFYGDNCLPCKTLEQRVLNQESVVKTLNRYFICVRVNASKEPRVATDFAVHSWPTDVFVSPDGQTLFQGVSKQDIGGYMDVLQSVAVMNKDRNTTLAADREKQQNTTQQNTTLNQPTGTSANGRFTSLASSSSLPPVSQSANPTASSIATAPISSSLPASQFRVASTPRPAMMDSQAGLPPLPAHLTTKPLGNDGLGGSAVANQMSRQSNLPSVVVSSASNASSQNPHGTTTTGPAGSLVSNPYYPQAVDTMVCLPDGTCGPAPGSTPSSTKQQMRLASNVGQQYPSLAGTPTFQPKSATLVSNTTEISQQPNQEPQAGQQPNTSQPDQQLSESSSTAANASTEPAAYNGYCPIALVTTGQKIQGNSAFSVRHRGRTYVMQSPDAVRQFMQAPDRYSPILSGYDPMVFLTEGKLVEGTLEHALHDPTNGTVVLFANAESLKKFTAAPERNVKALNFIINAASK